jgi:hypothetical protein
MFMHMPKKLGIPVMVLVAACLGAYWWFEARPVRVGDWEVYQGTGRIERDADGQTYLSLSGMVRSIKPIFAYRGPLRAPAEKKRLQLAIEYETRTLWPDGFGVTAKTAGRAPFSWGASMDAGEGWKVIALNEDRTLFDFREMEGGTLLFFDDGKYDVPFQINFKVKPPRILVTLERP